MRKILETVTNTYKAVRLLSNPQVSALIEERLQGQDGGGDSLGSNDAFFHKHYIVQVTN